MNDFKRILIANRGAIATRIIRTLDEMGIDSVAVYAYSDRESLHVHRATQAVSLGEGGAVRTYLDIDKLLDIARHQQCDAVHPGYGFLSENREFVERCEAQGLAFIGPTPQQIDMFGQKHVARELALSAEVPLLPGTHLLDSLDEAAVQASNLGYPVMLKSTAGGGGIGMKLCTDEAELRDAFASVKRLGASNFANDGVFIEKAITRARHIEVQVFGDGKGKVVSLGERDCSAQRRNQKVIEECPAPDLSDELGLQLHATAERLLASVNYRNAGTVEFIVDADTQQFYFLEVNTRLQVEHGVTEMVFGVDLVNWMVRQAAKTLPDLDTLRADLTPEGHAIQVRLYAEDPYLNFQPCAGLLSKVEFPTDDGIRVDHWLEAGIEIPTEFDPMLAKLIAHASSREHALTRLSDALDVVELYGSETNVPYLRALCSDRSIIDAQMTTRFLDQFEFEPVRMDVVRAGTMTTVQDLPGRVGYWAVGVPPSGPFDRLSFSLGNQLLNNAPDCAGLEITLDGPALRFSASALVVVTGGQVPVMVDAHAVNMWTVLSIEAGQTLSIGSLKSEGARAYLCVAGGIQCPVYLGSRSTFTLGKFGGHNGAALRTGDVLHLSDQSSADTDHVGSALPVNERPAMDNYWTLKVVHGPHGAPDFFTTEDIAMLFDTSWQVHYNSSRTGVRLIGPTPQWARSDGGEAGLHPSNIHDNAYAFGSVDFTGDMPVILGPDGPSLGGFVCPITVINAELWKLGQLRAGDTVKFQATSISEAVATDDISNQGSAEIDKPTNATDEDSALPTPPPAGFSADHTKAIIHTRESDTLDAVYRAAGDRFLLIEYGDPVLSMESRFRAHALMQWLEQQNLPGILEMTPGIRSLQIHYDCHALNYKRLLDFLLEAEDALDTMVDKVSIPARVVHLPLSWDDEACQLAIDKYDQSVRKDAPWYPSNLEFIRRINGLDSIDDVKKIVFDASYLVMGLGDVYLGAPVATPVNPAHRLVTTKYNPARTWTAENCVGIGGSYMCVYGMEGPGGYQFVGRTLQMWNRYKQTTAFRKPWLLRFFDQIRFFEVSHQELMQIRQDFPHGRYEVTIEPTEISLAQMRDVAKKEQAQIERFTKRREQAFIKELEYWRESGQFNIDTTEPELREVAVDWPEDCLVIESPVSGSLWQRCVETGDTVENEQTLLIMESMKMEIPITSPDTLRVRQILFESGQRVRAGQPLIILETI
ncbi:MAG: urea carboxylase [Granulosicoccus sp.]